MLSKGGVWEKAGVNVSVVYGSLPAATVLSALKGSSPSAAGSLDFTGAGEGVEFFSASFAAVVYPRNPFVPTLHASYSYFEARRDFLGKTTPPKNTTSPHPHSRLVRAHVSHRMSWYCDDNDVVWLSSALSEQVERPSGGAPLAWWVSGATDLCPAYLFPKVGAQGFKTALYFLCSFACSRLRGISLSLCPSSH